MRTLGLVSLSPLLCPLGPTYWLSSEGCKHPSLPGIDPGKGSSESHSRDLGGFAKGTDSRLLLNIPPLLTHRAAIRSSPQEQQQCPGAFN